MAHHRHQNSNNSEWPRIASGQPGSIASKIYSRVHKASRRHYQKEGDRGDHSPRLVYERNKSRSIDSDMRSEQRKKSRRRESENTWTSHSPITDRSSPVGHRDANPHRHRSHSPTHFEPHHHNSHRSQQSEDSVTSNKYFAFHPSASPKRNRSSVHSQVKLCEVGKSKVFYRAKNSNNSNVILLITPIVAFKIYEL